MSKTKNQVIDQKDWTKYVISHNLDKDGFGAYIPGLGCRNVTLKELSAYYYWPGDVRGFFFDMCQHALPDTVTFKQSLGSVKITAKMTFHGGREWIDFRPVSEDFAKQEGKVEMCHSDWIDLLRSDLKNGTRKLLNGQTTE